MTIKEYIRKKVLGLTGLVETDSNPQDNRLTFINDDERVTRTNVKEYNIWYYGDSDELLNFYTYQNTLEYNFEPYYSRNKRNYFWAISSTESDIKRTHSGQPRNIVDTLVSIIRFPTITAGLPNNYGPVEDTLEKILRDTNLKALYKNEQMPLTLVEGWGCYKINWDLDLSDSPIPIYYRADNVDFVYKSGKIIGIIFKDWYTDGERRNYCLFEERYKRGGNLVIEKELYRVDTSGDFIVKVGFNEVPELSDTEEYIEIGPYDGFFAVPSILFKNTSKAGGYGRSIFTGKIDLFDDLDQCLSQASNTVRRSTTIEYFNSDYLERDARTGLPVQPKAYDRKYSVYTGQKDADGASSSENPVQVVQPALNFDQYTNHAENIFCEIIQGIMSPATLGVDISKRDNALAQREKEKITIFTRNGMIDVEMEILKSLVNQLLCANEFMHRGVITCKNYDISIKFSEFADDSYENKLEKLGIAFDSELISEDMYMSKLYSDTLSRSEYEKELAWLKKHHTQNKDNGFKGQDGGGLNPLLASLAEQQGGGFDDEDNDTEF